MFGARAEARRQDNLEAWMGDQEKANPKLARALTDSGVSELIAKTNVTDDRQFADFVDQKVSDVRSSTNSRMMDTLGRNATNAELATAEQNEREKWAYKRQQALLAGGGKKGARYLAAQKSAAAHRDVRDLRELCHQ